MAFTLIECCDCRRHVRSIEQSCPFCGSSIDEVTRARAMRTRRPSLGNVPRAVALGLTVGVVAVSASSGGCSEDIADDGASQPLYGAPAVGGSGAGGTPGAGSGGEGGGGGSDGGAGGGGSGGGTAGAGGGGGTGG